LARVGTSRKRRPAAKIPEQNPSRLRQRHWVGARALVQLHQRATALRWAERHGFKAEIVETTPGEEAGIRSATLTVEGPYAYGYLKTERGTHRLVRISPFDFQKRRHIRFSLCVRRLLWRERCRSRLLQHGLGRQRTVRTARYIAGAP